MKYLSFVFAIISTILLGISNTSANEYGIELYTSNITSNSIMNPVLSYSNNGSFVKSITMNGYASTYANVPYLVSFSYYSPFNTLITTSTKTFTGQQNCINYGSVNINYLENKGMLSGTFTNKNITIKENVKLTSNKNNIDFIVNDNNLNDSKGNVFNYYYAYDSIGSGPSPQIWTSVQKEFNLFTYSFSCNANTSNFYPYPIKQYGGYTLNPCGASLRQADVYHRFFVFNSSESGIMEYHYNLTLNGWLSSGGNPSGAGTETNNYTIGYYELKYPTTFNFISSSSANSGNLTLFPNTIYVFQISEMISFGGQASCTLSPVYYFNESKHNDKFSIDIRNGNWDCGEWSNCSNGYETRLCNDLNGYFVDKVESQSCYSLPIKTMDLGFENSTSVNVFYSQPFWWILGCLNYPAIKTVEYPNNWKLNPVNHPYLISNATTGFLNINNSGYAYDDLAIVYDDSMEGIKSLKLWYIPPTTNMVNCANMTNGASCEFNAYGNTTIGYFPKLQKDINETYMVSKDISFSYPNMTITYYAKKCSEPVQSWAGNSTLLSLCGNGYYTNSRLIENVEPTDIFFSIYDYNLSSVIYDTKFNIAIPSWQKAQFRLINLDTSHLYRFEMGIMPKDYPVDTKSYCAYVDGLDINAYSGSIPCNSHCGDINAGELLSSYYKASQTSDYGCSFSIEKVSPKCIGLIHANEIKNCVSFCSSCNSLSSDYLTYYESNNETGICEWNIIANSSYCSEYCVTQNIKEPNTITETVNKLSLFLSPIFLIAFMILGIGAFLAYKTKSWQVLAIVVIVGFLIAGTVWIELAFISLCIIIVVAYFLAKEHGNPSGGN